MNRRWSLISFLTVLLCNAANAQSISQPGGMAKEQLDSYSFLSVEVPNAQGELGFTGLAGINDKGEIVGGFAAAESQGFVISRRGEITRIGCPNVTFTALLGINNSGAMVGSVRWRN